MTMKNAPIIKPEPPTNSGIGIVPTTLWEKVAETTWGAYISALEENLIRRAGKMAPIGTVLDVGCEGARWSKLLVDQALGGQSASMLIQIASSSVRNEYLRRSAFLPKFPILHCRAKKASPGFFSVLKRFLSLHQTGLFRKRVEFLKPMGYWWAFF